MKKIYRKIVKAYRLWYYLRLFRKLFWYYTRSGMDVDSALGNALKAFEFLAGFEYRDIYKRYS